MSSMQRILRWLAVLTSFGMGLVLLQGTLVTNTNSQYGCGDTWPLCHGKLIPEFSGLGGAATLIEFSHRAVVPVESTLILAFAAGVFWRWRRRLEIRVLAPAMIVFLLLQAVLGGLAVMFPTSAEVLALHFGVSLLAFASIILATAFVLEVDGPEAVRDRPLPGRLQALIWIAVAATYAVVYLGAYVRHVGAGLACLDWPLCNGSLVPRFDDGVGTQLVHRLGALLLTSLVTWLFLEARRTRRERPDLYRAALLALLLVLLQAVSGGIVVGSRLSVLSTLLHSGLVALLFATQAYLCLHALRRPPIARLQGAGPERLATTGPSGVLPGWRGRFARQQPR